MREESILEDAERTTQSSKGNSSSAKQTSIEDIDVARNALESLKLDTSHTSRQLSQVRTDADEKRNKLRHQKTLNKIQTPNIIVGNIQLKTLPESQLQRIQNNHTQCSLVPMKSPCQLKR